MKTAMDWANRKEICECGGKYANKNKRQHEATQKHVKYLSEIEADNKIVVTMAEIEADIEHEFKYCTITEDDPEFLLLNAHTVKAQMSILNRFSRNMIPQHLTSLSKKYYYYHMVGLYETIKNEGRYCYKPPDRVTIRAEIITRFIEDGYRIEAVS